MSEFSNADMLKTGSHGRFDGAMPVPSVEQLYSLPSGWRINTFRDGYQANNGKQGSARQVTYISKDFDTIVREAHRIVNYSKTRVKVNTSSVSKQQMSIFDLSTADDDMPF